MWWFKKKSNNMDTVDLSEVREAINPEPVVEEKNFNYYDAYLIDTIKDIGFVGLFRMRNDCEYAVGYFETREPDKAEFFRHCLTLCEERLVGMESPFFRY